MHSVRDFARLAFELAGLNYEHDVVSDPKLYRPAEVDLLQGNAAYASRKLGWSHEIGFEERGSERVESGCRALGVGAHTMKCR